MNAIYGIAFCVCFVFLHADVASESDGAFNVLKAVQVKAPGAGNGRLLVGFKSQADAQKKAAELIKNKDVKGTKQLNSANILIVDTPAAAAAGRVTALLKADKAVSFVEEDTVSTISFTPNDPKFSQLWGMNKIGAPTAWDSTVGSKDIIVCVIDSGVDYNHPDLAANMWKNPGEQGLDANGNDKATNGIDDDGNGYVDDVHGINAITKSGNPLDDNNHGTHCAGTIGGVGNNNVGVAGVSHSVSIMACKFLDSAGSGYTSNAVLCLDYAIKMGAHITSNSYGGGGFLNSFNTMLNAAQAAGQLFVAAAGNSGVNNDVSTSYPSNYPQDIVLAVAATDSNDLKASFSQYGLTTVDLGAPGVGIVSTTPNNQYASFSGTSMATPHVAGAAALIKSAKNTLTGLEIKSILMATVDPVPSLATTGPTPVVSGGRMNIANGVALAIDPNWSAPTPAPTPAPPCLGDGVQGCNSGTCCSGLVCTKFGSRKGTYYQCVSPTTPAPAPAPAPPPGSCTPKGGSCSVNSDCCSNTCTGRKKCA